MKQVFSRFFVLLLALACVSAPLAAAEPSEGGGAWSKVKAMVTSRVGPAWEYVKGRFTTTFAGVSEWGKAKAKAVGSNESVRKFTGKFSGLQRAAESSKNKISGGSASKDKDQTVIRLANGSAITCRILAQDARHVVVFWEGGEVTFSRSEILSIDQGQAIKDGDGIYIPQEAEKKSEWPYQHNPVVQLKNGQVIDAAFVEVRPEMVILKEDLGSGSSIDHEIGRERIETLVFKPVVNPISVKIEEKLKVQFPKMKFYRDGILTLVTDSEGASLKRIRQTLDEQLMTLYFEFYGLIGGREPQAQHFVVVFDDLEDYFVYATADGVPAWLCPGYFAPDQKVLYMMNYVGDAFTKILYEVVEGSRADVNRQADALKSRTGGKYDTQIDGLAQDFKIKIENAVGFMKGIFSEVTLVVLRHELTHEFLHDWGVQTIVVSKQKEESAAMTEKKRQLLATDDIEKKKKLIIEVLGMHRKEDAKDIKIEASNSWFVEGTAEYAATSALGNPNNLRLFAIKDARKKNELLPLEHLTVYKTGSFPGVATGAALSAYAQSWSLVEFLMKNYRAGFMKYLKRMATEKPTEQDDLRWLLEATGQDLRKLESEWHAHIDTLPDAEDPEIAQWFRVREILGMQ